jgi:LacI family transcriptional regulator
MTTMSSPTKRPTIRDIASMAGVSIATVSRVLNERPEVSPETRARVLEVVSEQGFSARWSARALSNGNTGLVAMTIPVVHAEYFANILSGVAEALHERDMRIVLFSTQHEPEREVRLFERLRTGTVDGAIIMLPSERSPQLLRLLRSGQPLVVVDDREPIDPLIPVVSAAHATGAREATEHLLSLGHRRIAAITGPRRWIANKERLAGYHAALAAAHVPRDRTLEVESDFQRDGGHAAAQHLLGLPEPPTAIFAFNDNMAVGAMRAASELGLTVPGDLSVVGFDDSDQSTVVAPQLTTVRQPLAELGRMAASLLLRQLHQHSSEPLRVELATKLVVRGSTGPPGTFR